MPDFHLFSKGPRPVAPFSHAVEALVEIDCVARRPERAGG